MKFFQACLAFLILLGIPLLAGASSIIPSGTTLLPGQYVTSNNGNFSFGIDPGTHNLFFHYKFPVQAWGSSPNASLLGTSSEGSMSAGTKGDRLVMQSDGTLALYSGDTQVWTTAYMGKSVPGSYAVVEDYGDVSIYPPGGAAYPLVSWPFVSITPDKGKSTIATGYPFSIFFPGLSGRQTLEISNSVTYYYWNKSFAATALNMQTDGNLVVYNNTQAVWSTGTSGNDGAFVTVTPVGFVLARPSSGMLANIPYPVSVSDTGRAAHSGDSYEKIQNPDPSLVLPIGPGWQCFGTESGMVSCFAPGGG